jgi:hypothetical protein
VHLLIVSGLTHVGKIVKFMSDGALVSQLPAG